MPPVLDVIHGLVIQNLVGLRSVLRAGRLIDLLLLMKDLSIAPGGAQQKQSGHHKQSRPLGGRQEGSTVQTSPLSRVSGSAPPSIRARGFLRTPSGFGTFKYNLNERPGRTTTLPLGRPPPAQTTPLSVMPARWTKGCLLSLTTLEVFQITVAIACRSFNYYAIVRTLAVRTRTLSKWTSVCLLLFIVAPRFHVDQLENGSLPTGLDTYDVLFLLRPRFEQESAFFWLIVSALKPV